MSAGEETMGHAVNSVRKGIMIDQTQPFIPSSLPHQRNAFFPLKALVEPSRKFATFHGSPLPTQLGQHLGLAFRPFFSVAQPSLQTSSLKGSRPQADSS